jgi:hypothetical protein
MKPFLDHIHLPWAEREMLEGYFDGRDPACPMPSSNRSHSYHHGFANGRDDLRGQPRDTAANLREMADAAIRSDMGETIQ